MLQIKHICKEYRTGSLVQKALDDVSLNLRDNEFVAILGPSGSGKTTLLNIIGGLDRYDSGDLIINGISTKKYKDRDWDSYRNHTIGFVFQSYNLIPHQTVLANVELALTISGIGKAERRRRAKEALDQVGLGDQIHKKPNQMSGGQMQRVAIARALVNDPDILLADEPTGALDSDTSIQVMDLLREVARDRLVVMVTHNPELAEKYATRIVNLRDGRIRSDTDPFEVDEGQMEEPGHRNMGKASMSFLTALSLSFNNLKTKKARTLLTSFAGSIGIIGIALILSLSTGVNDYIKSIEEETMAEYPLQIQSTGLDLTSMMAESAGGTQEDGETGEVEVAQMLTSMFSTMDSNDLASLKKFLDSPDSGIGEYTNAVEYTYDTSPHIYRQDADNVRQVHPDTSFEALGLGSESASNSIMSMMMSTDVFYEMPQNENLYQGQYDVKAGRWPENYNECVVVLTSRGGISDFMLYTLGLRDSAELDEMIQQFIDEENVDIPENIGSYDYEDFLGITFKLVNPSDCYEYDSQYHVWRDKTQDSAYMKNLVNSGEDITIVGVVQPTADANGLVLSSGIGYPASLTTHVAQEAAESEIVRQQLASPDMNVFTGEPFGEESGESNFDMDSLITVDEEALTEAFGFDESSLSEGMAGAFDFSSAFGQAGDSLDLSGAVDLSGIDLTLPDMGTLNLGDIMGDLDISISSEVFGDMASGLLAGYQEYAEEHPEADYSGLGDAFAAFMQTPEGQEILSRNIQEIIQSGGGMEISSDQIRQLFQDILAGYGEYVQEMGYEDAYQDPEQFSVYLTEYLGTAEAQAILEQWGSEILAGADFTVSGEQLQSLASELASGYQAYAQSSGAPDPGKMGQYFMAYLNTDQARQILTEGLQGAVDTSRLESQISEAVEGYMGSALSSFGTQMRDALEEQISSAMQQAMNQLSAGMETALQQAMGQVGDSLQNAVNMDADAFAAAFQMNMSGEELAELMMSMDSGQNATYENNLRTLGYINFAEPGGIDIYPKDFESKEEVVRILDDYNSRMESEGKEEQVITYTDVVGSLMSSVTEIVDIISYVLIAFVAISLIVSSIMIGVITYISVLERKKEIGILRAIGASKHNISQVFNAETFIIGLCAGLIGIGLTLLILIPGNMLIHHLAGTTDISAALPVVPAVVLILLSVLLTLVGGLIPSRKAAKSDPVTALRTE